MNRVHKKKMTAILLILAAASCALGLILYALRQNINLFYTPDTLIAANVSVMQTVRVGGYVEARSVHYARDGKQIHFAVTDQHQRITVLYAGILPTLFREGQGVVVTGHYASDTGVLTATEVLAKHDEKYMPRMVADALQRKPVPEHFSG